ncbi:MAG: DegV family protein [Ruminococcus sp.]|nr:DegV family protein [Ruminococcus sp.]
MSKIKILTDSASDIDKKTAEEYGIHVIGFSIVFDGKEYTEGVDFTAEEFYEMMSSSSDFPKTSQIKTEQFTECFEKFFDEGYTDVIYISISSTGSATHGNSVAAKEAFYEKHPEAAEKMNIHIVDSLNYTAAYGYPAIEAANKANRGADADEIIAYLEDWIPCAELHFVAYTLEYVKRSGRLSAAAAFMGELLGLKPIITVTDGVSSVPEKIRGEKNIIPKMIELAKKNMIPQTPYALLEGSLPEESEVFKKEITKAIGYPPERVFKIGSTISCHAGHKVIGFVIKGQKRG